MVHAVNRIAVIFLSYSNGTLINDALGDTRISLQAIMGVANVAAASGLVASEPVSSFQSLLCRDHTQRMMDACRGSPGLWVWVWVLLLLCRLHYAQQLCNTQYWHRSPGSVFSDLRLCT